MLHMYTYVYVYTSEVTYEGLRTKNNLPVTFDTWQADFISSHSYHKR